MEDCNPFPCLAAAVNRTDEKGLPRGRLRPAGAHDGGAGRRLPYGRFYESGKGRLKPGDLAGLVVVGRDIFAIDPLEIGAARVLLTMVGGEVACRRH